MSEICAFFRGKNVLVTGATGFCGKVLVEKLLRSCEDIGKIFVIIRKKKKASTHERYIDYVNHFIFDKVRTKNDSIMQKIIFVNGDITLDGLALSTQDEQMLVDEVNIVFHCAANVRFNDPLKEAININTTGTLRLLQLAKKMKNLKVFSYMSTAFSQSYRLDLEERYYPSNLDVFEIIKMTEKQDDEGLCNLERELLRHSKHLNTYTLSKALGEEVVHHFKDFFPTVIIRPSQIWSSVNEPFEGYIEGLNSGIGIICGIMSGFIRSMYASDGSGIKFSPADFVINATIASAWKRSTAPRDEFLVFNCTDAESHKIEWKESMKLAYPYFLKYAPYEKLVWFPNASITSSYVWHMISLVLFQLLPAVFADLILVLSGRKRMFTSLQMKVIKGMQVLYDFTGQSFHFETIKLQELYAGLKPEDKKLFFFDHTSLDWNKYFETSTRLGRQLILKDDESTIPKAQKKLNKFYYADWIVKILFVVLGLWLLKNIFFK